MRLKKAIAALPASVPPSFTQTIPPTVLYLQDPIPVYLGTCMHVHTSVSVFRRWLPARSTRILDRGMHSDEKNLYVAYGMGYVAIKCMVRVYMFVFVSRT